MTFETNKLRSLFSLFFAQIICFRMKQRNQAGKTSMKKFKVSNHQRRHT